MGQPNLGTNGVVAVSSVADELQRLGAQLAHLAGQVNGCCDSSGVCRQVGARLVQLAAELKVRNEADAEMRENYPHFKEIVYDLMQKHFDRTCPPLPEGKNLETIAAEEGALPLEAFWPELFTEKASPNHVG
jgi:hypothetical protein